MKIHKKIKFHDDFFFIIKLDDDEKEVIKHEFAISYAIPYKWEDNYYLDSLSLEERIKSLKINNSNIFAPIGFFDTELEAYYHIKLMEACETLDLINKEVKNLNRIFSHYNGNPKTITIHWFGDHLNDEPPANGIYE